MSVGGRVRARVIQARVIRACADDDRGAASVFVLGMIVVLMILAGLVVDGGRAVNARVAIIDDAEQAARSGANQLGDDPMRGGVVGIDPVAASDAARAFLIARGYDAANIVVTADAAEVSVDVSDTVPTALLQLAFISSYTVEGAATATALVGINQPITGAP